jgi:hypothetical protein
MIGVGPFLPNSNRQEDGYFADMDGSFGAAGTRKQRTAWSVEVNDALRKQCRTMQNN